jgi:hypothetical protein
MQWRSSRYEPPETATGVAVVVAGALVVAAAVVAAVVVAAFVVVASVVASASVVAAWVVAAVVAALVVTGVAAVALPVWLVAAAARTPNPAVALAASEPITTVRCRTRRTLASRF